MAGWCRRGGDPQVLKGVAAARPASQVWEWVGFVNFFPGQFTVIESAWAQKPDFLGLDPLQPRDLGQGP